MYTAEGTRPLSLASTDSKTIASAMRLCLEPCADAWVSGTQRGFIGGRKMSRNILEMDIEARESALRGERSLLVLFDFKAAFPSLDHGYLHSVLQGFGLGET